MSEPLCTAVTIEYAIHPYVDTSARSFIVYSVE